MDHKLENDSRLRHRDTTAGYQHSDRTHDRQTSNLHRRRRPLQDEQHGATTGETSAARNAAVPGVREKGQAEGIFQHNYEWASLRLNKMDHKLENDSRLRHRDTTAGFRHPIRTVGVDHCNNKARPPERHQLNITLQFLAYVKEDKLKEYFNKITSGPHYV